MFALKVVHFFFVLIFGKLSQSAIINYSKHQKICQSFEFEEKMQRKFKYF